MLCLLEQSCLQLYVGVAVGAFSVGSGGNAYFRGLIILNNQK